MHQIVFNEISAGELSAIPTMDQLELMEGFQVDEEALEKGDAGSAFGCVARGGSKIYRYRTGEYRVYFTIEDEKIVIQRVLHANSLKDFLFRSGTGGTEDQKLAGSRKFWQLIEAGQKAPRK